MEWYTTAVFLFIGLGFLLALGVPVAFSLGLISFGGIYFFIGPQGLGQILILMIDYGTNPGFICLPLFVIMAELIALCGAAGDIFNAVQKWLNRLPGSLAISTTVASGAFGAACGTSSGGAAAMGLVTIPELLSRGYSRSLTTGTVAAGGTLSILIPPSGIMILYCLITENSIGRLFIAGIIPGIMMVLLFSLYIMIYAILRPEVAPPFGPVSWRERVDSLRPIWAISLVVFIVFGSIYSGVGTVNEAAALGAFAALIIAIQRGITWHRIKEMALRTTHVTCFIFFIIFGAMTFGYLLAYLRIPFELSQMIGGSGISPMGIIASIMILYIILGCFLDPASILVLTVPILYPIIEKLGFNPIWFGILATINMEMGNITPPVGLNLFVIKSISPAGITMTEIVRGSLPFVGILAVGLILVMAFPQIALWLPDTMMGK